MLLLPNKLLRLLSGVTLALLVAACSQIPVSTDRDPAWHPEGELTFRWQPPGDRLIIDPLVDNDLFDRRVQRSVTEGLRARGLREAAAGESADLIVRHYITHRDRLRVSPGHHGLHARGYFGHSRYSRHSRRHAHHGFGGAYPEVRQYTSGTLIIDIVDAASERLVWRGVAERRVPSLPSPEARDAYVSETVTAILAEFPARGATSG